MFSDHFLKDCSIEKQNVETYLYISSDPFFRVPTPPFFILRTANSCDVRQCIAAVQ
jgi:hypothetical protein